MKRNIKNSLLFGLAVGGLFSLLSNAGEKTKLTDAQLKDINILNSIFTKVRESLLSNLELTPVYTYIKEKSDKKLYQEIEVFLNKEIQTNQICIGMIGDLETRLKYVLSGKFTADRANAKTHEVQSFFLSLKRFPDVSVSLLNKRIQIINLIKQAFVYIESGETTDFKSEDTKKLQSFVSEFQILSKDLENQLKYIS